MQVTRKEKQNIFNRLWAEDKWTELREYLFHWLKEEPDSHWLLAQISETYYLERQFNEALEYAEKAWSIEPHCPMVIWKYAESLLAVGEIEKAEPLYRSLIRRGVNRIAYGECGEGIRDARTLVNDSRYSLGFIMANKGEFSLAKRFIKKHVANRSRNCTSTFMLRDVKKDLALVIQGKKPRFRTD